MNNLLNKNEALEAMLRQAGLKAEYVRLISCTLNDNYYELELRSDWMWYEGYVGAVSGTLAGFNYEPWVDTDCEDGENCAALLGDRAIFAA